MKTDSLTTPVAHISDHTGTEALPWRVGALTPDGQIGPRAQTEVIHAVSGEAAMAHFVKNLFGELPYETILLSQLGHEDLTRAYRVIRHLWAPYAFADLGPVEKITFKPEGIEFAA